MATGGHLRHAERTDAPVDAPVCMFEEATAVLGALWGEINFGLGLLRGESPKAH